MTLNLLSMCVTVAAAAVAVAASAAAGFYAWQVRQMKREARSGEAA